ncbi:hypothetical protein AB0C74_39665 [Spirillospora sp. NPDC048832]
MRGTKQDRAEVDTVAAVQEQTQQAAALAGISGQELLSDPRLNPATRGHADRLRIAQQVKALDAEHARLLRRDRVSDARASEAERTLEAIALARRASSPARSVMALHNGRRLWSRLAVTASVVLAAGSAMGVEAAAQHLTAPTGTGYIAEIGLTGLSTAAITYRAHLAEHRGELDKGSWQARTLWALMIVPMLVSVAANLATLNALGAMCSIGAAAFAALGAVVADRSAAAMQARAAEVDDADEAELRAVAMGEDLPAAPAAAPVAVPSTVTRSGADVVQDDEDADGEAGAGHIVPRGAEGREGGHEGGHIDSDRAEDDDADPTGEDDAREGGGPVMVPDMARVLAAAEARRAAGEQTRARVKAYLTRHPDATIPQIATGLQISDATAKRHRRALRGANGVEL